LLVENVLAFNPPRRDNPLLISKQKW
jgi:hypothetical protein